MTTYIALFSLTDAGIKAAKDSPRRLDAAKKLLVDMGGEMKQFYMVMGTSTLSVFARRQGRRVGEASGEPWPARALVSPASE